MALAAFAFAACSDDNDETLDPSSAGNNSGAKYMAINIVTNSSDTRATADETTDGGSSATTTDNRFNNGDGNEYQVENMLFYFFDDLGNAFPVSSTADGEYVNYKVPTEIGDAEESEEANITQTHSVVAIEPKTIGTLPSQVVVVLNYTFAPTNCTLSELRIQVINSGQGNINSNTCMLMSNSVYQDKTGIVYATHISSEYLKDSKTEAEGSPVNIYVERVAAKVTTAYKINGKEWESTETTPQPVFPVLDEKGTANKKIDVYNSSTTKTTYKNLYVRIVGYNLINNAKKSTLMKNVTGYDNFPTEWNDANNYRSYWATTNLTEEINKTTGEIITTDIDNQKYKYSGVGENVSATYYPLENTLSGTDAKNTGLIFAAQIEDENGNTVPLVRMLTQYYTPAGAKKAIASYLSGQLYTNPAGETDQTALTADDFELVPTTTDDYYSTIQLKNQNETDKKYAINCYAEGSSDTLTAKEIQKIIGKLPKIMYWNEGKCYYYTTITHLPGVIQMNGKDVYGVVRNHWYELTINNILGLGTPVPSDDPVTPTRPTEEEWYLSTTINMLAWRKDAQDITLVSSNQ
jgi:hypothetical protein